MLTIQSWLQAKCGQCECRREHSQLAKLISYEPANTNDTNQDRQLSELIHFKRPNFKSSKNQEN